MAHENKVLESIETPDGDRCVDFFRRPDGSHGFEEYRREMEDGHGWYPIGFYADQQFQSEAAAREEAAKRVPWLTDLGLL